MYEIDACNGIYTIPAVFLLSLRFFPRNCKCLLSLPLRFSLARFEQNKNVCTHTQLSQQRWCHLLSLSLPLFLYSIPCRIATYLVHIHTHIYNTNTVVIHTHAHVVKSILCYASGLFFFFIPLSLCSCFTFRQENITM